MKSEKPDFDADSLVSLLHIRSSAHIQDDWLVTALTTPPNVSYGTPGAVYDHYGEMHPTYDVPSLALPIRVRL